MILKALRERKITPEEAKMQLEKLNKNVSDENQAFGENAIAIIGMSGRYPKANDMGEYWDILVNGKDGIREIPNSRWNMDEYYDPEKAKEGKIYCKWLGMIDDAECFDPLFFEIPPSEAETMEPLHRIFIEEGYKAFEDAGYTRQNLSNQKCGIYAGMITGEYEKLSQKYGNEKTSITGSSNAIGAARLSYYLNLKGPAISVDTACSSSMVCVHLAAQALERKEIDMALVGGSSLYLSAEAYVAMCSAGMLSPEGKCKTFDNHADGFVPGEGAGALVLKRLEDAQKDQDHIYGVIIGSGMNQDGKTNGITAPNLGSQIELVRDIYKEYDISPESISYAEMHGTGTKLGDPIELEALGTAFSEKTSRKNYCAIGSVKSNLGHTSAASGMAGIQKVILCMQHKKMVPTLNVKEPNEHFDFENSPFYINTEVKEWENNNQPRRACVSSFGYSGTNTHVIIQEYNYPKNLDVKDECITEKNPGVFVLSAKSEEQLIKYAKKMIPFIQQSEDLNLSNYLYTLQVGREAMKERLAMTVNGIDDLLEKLNKYVTDGADNLTIFRGTAVKKKLNYKKGSDDINKKQEKNEPDNYTDSLIQEWILGKKVNWLDIYNGKRPRIISVPTIPLARDVFWYKDDNTAVPEKEVLDSRIVMLHPLVHQNTSDFSKQSFCSVFDGNEFFLNEHKIGDTKVLPGAAIIEMARAAAQMSGDKRVKSIKDIIWFRPVAITEKGNKVIINLYPDENQAAFEVCLSDSDQNEEICAEGKIEYGDICENIPVNRVADIVKRCPSIIDNGQLYKKTESDIFYGAHFQCIKNIRYNSNEAIAELKISGISEHMEKIELDNYVLHPGLLDSSMQTIFPFMQKEKKTYLPFSLEKIEIYNALSKDLYVHTTKIPNDNDNMMQRFNLDIMDQEGNVLSKITGLCVKASKVKPSSNMPVLFLKSIWGEEKIIINSGIRKRILVFDCNDTLCQNLNKEKIDCICVQPGNSYIKLNEKQYTVNMHDKNSYLELFQDIRQEHNTLPEYYICNVTEKNEDCDVYAMLAFTQAMIELRCHNKIQLKYLYNTDLAVRLPEWDAMGAFFKTVQKENNNLFFHCVGISVSQMGKGSLEEIVKNELDAKEDNYEVHYEGDKRYVKYQHTVPVENQYNPKIGFKENGVYIITGGMGGVGLILARYICSKYNANVVLTGRSRLNKEIETKLKELSINGSQAYYIQADVSNKKDVNNLIAEVKSRYHKINGIIHSAGINKDALIRNKKIDEFKQVLAPKVDGTRNLDEALAKEQLDFFVMCSSTSAVLGNFGQCDYCYANSYMDHYAKYREMLTSQKKRYGKTVSINWPYWEEGGMLISEESKHLMEEKMGMYPLSSQQGIEALEYGISGDESQLICVAGDPEKLYNVFGVAQISDFSIEKEEDQEEHSDRLPNDKTDKDGTDTKQHVIEFLKSVFSEKMKIQMDKIDIMESFDTYGIDSIIIMTLTRRLEEDFGELPKTLFFEYQNIDELADYFTENYKTVINKMFAKERNAHTNQAAMVSLTSVTPEKIMKKNRFWKPAYACTEEDKKNVTDIAIIGISGKYPMADDLAEFWTNIENGKDCISEIPKERWNHDKYFNSEKDVPGKAYAKWGGFVNDIDKFDPLFFNISPGEADFLDPQARLFLETVWHTLEDAGYTRTSLGSDKVGVFVGVMYSMYELLEGEVRGKRVPVTSSFSAIANRVSYFMNFHGPSVAVDTMCSSSLTAIHLACESIKNGDSDLVIAGGVNLTVHPNKYLLLSQGHFASTDGRCRTFGKDGNGYVPGEGVGAILLKPLDKAIADHDNIYAVIKGSTINACGKTNGFTVPSPNVQASLIKEALKKTDIDARSISYIEAHGTGTSLGDPIEIKGLTKAFKSYTDDLQFCSIGSVKSNIGHLESAAGIAAITKTVLQLRNRKLVPSIHSDELNPYINFSETPFYVQHELEEWKKPVLVKDGIEAAVPRRAGISAFGAGGSNAHIILEEYNSEKMSADIEIKQRLYVFSAKNNERLNEYLRTFLNFIHGKSHIYIDEYTQSVTDTQTDDIIKILCEFLAQTLGISTDIVDCNISLKEYGFDEFKFNNLMELISKKFGIDKSIINLDSFSTVQGLADYILANSNDFVKNSIHMSADSIAYILQTGREAMEERVAIKADSVDSLAMKIENYLYNEDMTDIYTGNILDAKEDKDNYKKLQEEALKIEEYLLEENYDGIAKLWVNGMEVEWKALYHDHLPQKVSLPGYCFAKEHCWVLNVDELNQPAAQNGTQYIHPMLHTNKSDLHGLKFSSSYSGNEFFMKDHVVNGTKMLPAVAYLEIIYAAAKEIFDLKNNQTIVIKNVIWVQPFIIKDTVKEIQVSFTLDENENWKFDVFSCGQVKVVHCQGMVQISEEAKAEQLDIEKLREVCKEETAGYIYYNAFDEIGLNYGNSLRSIQRIYKDGNQALVELFAPECVKDNFDNFILHPSILDGALQSNIAFFDGKSSNVTLPFALNEIEIFRKCSTKMFAHIKKSTNNLNDKLQKIDIDICDAQGYICAKINQIAFREFDTKQDSQIIESDKGHNIQKLMFVPEWEACSAVQDCNKIDYEHNIVVLCNQDDDMVEKLKGLSPDKEIISLFSKGKNIAVRYNEYATSMLDFMKNLFSRKINGKIFVQFYIENQKENRLFAGINGFLKTAYVENPNVVCQLIETDAVKNVNEIYDLLDENASMKFQQHIRYIGDVRYVRKIKELENQEWKRTDNIWKEKGIYFITGGAGGLGLLVAQDIASSVKESVLILTGRSELKQETLERIEKIRKLGADISYHRVDITDENAVSRLIDDIVKRYGALNGVIHCSGVIRDSLLVQKTKDTFEQVLAPKVQGIVNLDNATKNIVLDWFITFSSMASIIGNLGQSDYAAANGFMDCFVEYRNTLADKRERFGRAVSLNWPLWRDGGMQIGSDMEQVVADTSGFVPIERESGIQLLHSAVLSGYEQVLPVEGFPDKIRNLLLNQNIFEEEKEKPDSTPLPKDSAVMEERLTLKIKNILAEEMKLDISRIDARVPLENYGIDSVMIIRLTNALEKSYGPLPKTLFFDNQSIKELVKYLCKEFYAQTMKVLGMSENESLSKAEVKKEAANTILTAKNNFWQKKQTKQDVSITKIRNNEESLDIAIVGIAGRYPMADDVEEYWKNLTQGKDCVTEIPKERWDYRKYYDPDKSKKGKTYAKWGGFLDNVDCFDPMFFHISPVEAEIMDPQERLFLECVYHAIEDAGYTKVSLSTDVQNGLVNNVGVFVGVMYEEYQMYGAQAQIMGNNISLNGSAASIANRVSYIYGFHGPSIALDTMCSSSLVAVHLACNSIMNGECDTAIAGGVNLSIHPNKYLTLGRGKFVSSVGKCQTFGKDGDGYTPGEGVGAIVLKDRKKAIEDGDHIYGIIRGSAINHGGKTNGYTVPNPHAQTSVIKRAIAQAGISPRAISYIEAHGTGTSLGDPIEISALSRAFREGTGEKQFCKIGSVKSNIGHCESAAGIAGITKVLMQMKYGKLVPSLHSQILNPNIDFENSPFTVSHEYEEWKKPVIEENGVLKEFPRIAGISAFGAGGTNAHIIIEEYDDTDKDRAEITNKQGSYIVVLSARKEEQLKTQIRQLLEWLKADYGRQQSLSDIAYTLQVGREALEERAAFIVSSHDELIDGLESYLEGKGNYCKGRVKDSNTIISMIDDDDMQDMIEKWFYSGKFLKIAELWTEGLSIEWDKLYVKKPKRISLPNYPFAKEHYWISMDDIDLNTKKPCVHVIHPLVHENISDFYEMKFSSVFNGMESFFTDHRINGNKTMPAVGYMEMVYTAYAKAVSLKEDDSRSVRMKDVVWLNPLVVNDKEIEVKISLMPERGAQAEFQIYSEYADDKMSLYSKGVVELHENGDGGWKDIEEMKSHHNLNRLEAEKIYDYFQSINMEYGPAQRGIQYILCGSSSVLAKIQLPEVLIDTIEQYTLNPCILDSALQSAIGISLQNEGKEEGSAKLPFMIQEMTVFRKCTESMWAHIKAAEDAQTLQISLYDASGNLCVEIKDIYYREIEHKKEGDRTESPDNASEQRKITKNDENTMLYDETYNLLKGIFVKTLKIDESEIEEDILFEKYGVDSILIMSLNEELEKKFGKLPKTLLFEYQNMRTLTQYFINNHSSQLEKLAAKKEPIQDKSYVKAEKAGHKTTLRITTDTIKDSSIKDTEIAIIGLSGRYAKAENMDEYWENIKNGVDCITEIPPARWDYRKYFNPDKDHPGTTYTKWGGFLNNVDCFEPLFFNISPRDAVIMDPQERLFMECAYSAMEDAGYTRQTLGYCPGSEIRRNVGVFAGVMNEEYHLYAAQEQAKGYPRILSGNISQVANRFSYFCDFHGPSLTLDTMCSSSSVAIHLACQAIKNGECDMAIAGGVNVMIHPNKYLILASGKFASTNGKCTSFGKGGDGYVPGEGVGAVLLKPKQKAIEDGDHIYGIIKGTAVNHGGKTNGYTVPNPLAQAEVIESAMKDAGIGADSINYVEAHGTGTALGDPIEITALDKIYSQFGMKKHSCAVGSVKSNIGHCESASGIAALSKVLLQMKHKKIAPSLHSREINPNIDFDITPFYVPQELEDWDRIKVQKDGRETECPRTAGISSFGAGGTNAHIIVEEYVQDNPVHTAEYEGKRAIIVLSAKSKEQLFKIAANLLDKLSAGEITDIHSVAYTLQTGREEFEERMAFTASSIADLKDKLKEVYQQKYSSGIYLGEVYSAVKDKENMKAMVEDAIKEQDYEKLCLLWTKGAPINWSRLYHNKKPLRISLPSYPFADEKYFIETTPDINMTAQNCLHPVLHKNVSSFYEQRFVSKFTGNEYYISDHMIGGRKVLPGAVTLEMMRAAGQISLEHSVFIMKNMAWTNQIEIKDETDVYVSLYPHEDMIDCEVYLSSDSAKEPERTICCEGSIEFDDINDYEIHLSTLDYKEITKHLDHVLEGEACYDAMKAAGIFNETRFRVIEKIVYNNNEAVSYMHLSKEGETEKDAYVLHPSIINGAFQSVVGLMSQRQESKGMAYLPFALSEIKIYAPIEKDCLAYITQSNVEKHTSFSKFDILITDTEGNLLAELNEFTLKAFKVEPPSDTEGESAKMHYYTTAWRGQESDQKISLSIADNEVVLVFDDSREWYTGIKQILDTNGIKAEIINVESGNVFSKINNHIYQIDMTSQEQYEQLFRELKEEQRRPQKIVILKKAEDYVDDKESLKHIYSISYISKALMQLHQEKKIELIFAFLNTDKSIYPEYNAVGGFAKSILIENPNFCYKVVEIQGGDNESSRYLEDLLREFGNSDIEVQYRENKRYIKALIPSNINESISKIPIKNEGTYLITGGLGGLGMIFAKYIAQKGNTRLILTGRSSLKENTSDKINELKALGSDVIYLQADISVKADVEKIYAEVKNQFGKIDGIIHSAGVLKDSFVLKKSKEDMEAVFSSKIFGTRYLDEIFKDEKLDFFVLFSSIAGVFGNMGQSDYSYANSYMDYFAGQRNQYVSDKTRFGKTISINWPLWKEGKMQVDQKTQDIMKAESGLVPIDLEDGIRAFESGLLSSDDQLIVLKQVENN